ncbi:oligosaccharide flippase family protein [Alicyclobacillus macrosporangiidus]|uniref:Membrane protein involved in the export of O-antigen and teichoic acid n=1 Tax=Alicyclobacillus macrosporangiidus TaxID=392015 RepID=A0A1I7G5L0_9BACL|nr:oligosaccharide flippase family protein [Alicyclobacillus macrosporangiidus]SFU43713.1 Membrane protein involved in the export of O-antigen and teichoic acid [Alicyclobacillus macrosporangiidus]
MSAKPTRTRFHVIQTMGTNLAITLTTVVTGVLSARLLGPEAKGAQSVIVMAPSLLASLLTLALPNSLVYALRRSPESQREVMGVALLFSLVLGSVAALCGLAIIPVWLGHYDPATVAMAKRALVLTPVFHLTSTVNAGLQALGLFTIYNIARWLPPLLTAAGLLVLWTTHHASVLTVSLAYLLVTILTLIWGLVCILKACPPRIAGVLTNLKRLLSYGIRSYWADLLGTLSGQLDRIVVAAFLPARAVGLYVVAVSMANTLGVFSSALVSVFFPLSAGKSMEEITRNVGKAVRFAVVLVGCCCLFAALLGPTLLRILYGRSYLPALEAFYPLLVAALVTSLINVLLVAFLASNHPGHVSIVQFVGVASGALWMALLVPRYGLAGAGLSVIGSSVTRLVAVIIGFRKGLGTSFPRVLPVPSEVLTWLRQGMQVVGKVTRHRVGE